MRTKIIIGSLIAIIAILSISQTPIQADIEEDLFIIIDDLDFQNSELVLENDALYTKNAELTKKYVSESFDKKDTQQALNYLFDFVTEEQKQTALQIARQDTASSYWQSRQ